MGNEAKRNEYQKILAEHKEIMTMPEWADYARDMRLTIKQVIAFDAAESGIMPEWYYEASLIQLGKILS